MTSDPMAGLVFHWIGGLAAASFYLPFKGVKRWSWETYWLVGGFFSWIVAPIALALLLVPDLFSVLRESPVSSMVWAYVFGTLWGVGGLTFGLSVRYLGIALGYAIVLGMCSAFGTLVPPAFHGTLGAMFHDRSGQATLFGIVVCLVGIALSGLAGTSKEKDLAAAGRQPNAGATEFNFVKGLLVALFAGLLSAAMAFALDAATPVNDVAARHLTAHGRSPIWQGLPALVVVLLGGFTTNFVWCVILNIKNRTGHQYAAFRTRDVAEVSAAEAVATFDLDATAERSQTSLPSEATNTTVPLLRNYLFAAAAGVTWYFQFFFYTMGSTKMGDYGFSSWTLHMASIIIFSTLWGVALKEWKGTSARTKTLVGLGLFVLVSSTVIVGYGNYLKSPGH